MNNQNRNARILIVDDDEDDFIITSSYIQSVPGNSFIVDWAPTYKNGLERLATGTYDLYFVDYRLGAKSGVDFLKAARDMNSDAPIVLLTGKGNYAVDIEAMQLGAVDYLVKSELNTEKTERCVRYALGRASTLKALRKSENKYRSIFEKSKDIVFVASSDLTLTDVNSAIFALLGYPVDTAIGMNLLDIIPSESDRNYIVKAVANDNFINDRTISILTTTGIKLSCTVTLSVENSGKEDEYVQGIIHDITSLKKAEKATLQIEKLAATGRLVRTLAHEVRNPLNNISMSAEQLERAADEPELYLDIIKRNALRINSLITELLHSSNPRDNTQTMSILQLIIDEVIVATADKLTLKKMQLKVVYPDTPIGIKADKENLKLALLNIVVNAIEAMSDQTGLLTIEITGAGKSATLIIKDNGCGISEEHITRIFEPYFTRKRTGAGLGLAFTLNILRAHNAAIDVSSVLGSGTTFTISFPVFAEAS
jgi:PAS domain S-box-containing protein